MDPVSPVDVAVVLSADETIDGSDSQIGSAPVNDLAPGRCRTAQVSAWSDQSSGAFVLGAIADPMNSFTESDEANNAAAGNTIAFGYDADLVVTAVAGPASAAPYSNFPVSVSVCNHGQAPSVADVDVVLSLDDTIDGADTPIGSLSLGTLDPGACATQSLSTYTDAPDGAYTLGAIVDPYGSEIEIDESNNTFAGALVGVGYGPDLVVSALSGSPSTRLWGPFEVTLTVCNQGQGPGNAEVEIMMSTDEVIDSGDKLYGPAAPIVQVGLLEPGMCTTTTDTIDAGPPAEGVYFLGALADPYDYELELIESNNTHVGSLIGVGDGPDLVVTSVSGPPSAQPATSFQATVTVCNQGQDPSAGGSLDTVLSPDAAITIDDALVGNVPLDSLEPGACTVEIVPVNTSVADGEYTLGAIVDAYNYEPEVIESNNAYAGALIGVGYGPDLFIADMTGPHSAQPGQSFEATVTVCNQGQGSSTGSQVDVVLSADSVIDASDDPLAGAPVPMLDPNACAVVPIPVYAGPEGIYTLGAIVDAQDYELELIESNNAYAGALIGVGYKPDLTITDVSGPPSAQPAGNFEVVVTVCNRGQSTSTSADIEIMLSADDTIDLADFAAGNVPVGSLDPGACKPVTVPSYASSTEGVYTLGAVVDKYDYEPELIESNNAHAGALIGIGYGPDLVVTEVSGPPSVYPGMSFDAAVTVCNQGQGPSGGGDVEVRMSADGDLDLSDFLVGSAPIDSLEPGACTSLSVSGPASGTEGAYTLGAIADPYDYEPELIESNNERTGGLIGVGAGPDLVITDVSGPSSTQPGGYFEVAVTVCNQGQSSSYGNEVDVRLSADDTIDSWDAHHSLAYTDTLQPGQCTTVTTISDASVSEGVYTLGAIVDPLDSEPETLESNNALAGALIGVGYEADLVVTAVSGPQSVQPSSSFEVAVTVCNQGQGPSSSDVEVVLSADDTVDSSDYLAGGAPIGNLDPGMCATVTVPAYSSTTEGAYTLGAIADRSDYESELIESNNALAGALIGVGYGPDLVVTGVSGPPSAQPSSSFDVAVTVCNHGQGPSSSDVEVVLSSDDSIDSSDYLAGGAPIGNLDPGACATVTVPAYSSATEGAYTLGAIADRSDYEIELIESNNALAGAAIGVGYGPDLVVSDVTGPPSAQPSSSFDVTATVCNHGQGPASGSDVEVVLSADSVIGSSDYAAGNAPTGTLDPGMCTTVTVPVTAYVAEGAYTLGAVVDRYDYELELIEDNNAHAGALISIGNGPDLVITEVTGPPSALPSSGFDASVTICNQGQGPGPTTSGDVEVVLSTDDVIDSLDYTAGYAPVELLDPGRCTTVTVPAYADVAAREYTLGAFMKRDDYEFIDSNNALAGALIGVGYEADLVVTDVSGPASVTPSSSFEVTATVCNQGQGPSSSDVEVVLSADASIDSSDYLAGGAPLGNLDPGMCTTVTVPAYSSATEGAYTLGAIADRSDYEVELIESNNALAGAAIGVGYGPDLVVSDVSGPASAQPSSSFDVTATVCNQGQGPVPGSDVEVVLSADSDIDSSDYAAGSAPTGTLDPGMCTTVTVPAYAGVADGTYTLGAVVDRYDYEVELIESNNAHAGAVIGIGNGPDLVVTDVSGPASAQPSSSFDVTATVCNQGQGPVPGGDVDVVLSTDSDIDSSDYAAGSATTGTLDPGMCTTVTVSTYAGVADGAYTLGAIVDRYDYEVELIESNNVHAGALIGIGYLPDLVVTDVSGPGSAQPSSNFNVAVTVCNQGQGSVPGSDVEVMLSTDSVIDSSDYLAGGAPTNLLDPGMCTTVTVPAYAGVADGAYTLGARVDPYDYEYELIESNNTGTGGAISIAP